MITLEALYHTSIHQIIVASGFSDSPELFPVIPQYDKMNGDTINERILCCVIHQTSFS